MIRSASPLSLARQQYPDPFLDIASTKLPKTQKKLFELLWLFATTHPQISPIVKKLAKYPITKIIVNADNPKLTAIENKWKSTIENDLNFYEAAEAMGLDFFGLGNCFIVVHRPFIRMYTCNRCKERNTAGTVKYNISGKSVVGICPKCKQKTTFTPTDEKIRNPKGIRIVRIPPQDMYIKQVETTGEHFYYREVPSSLKRAVSKTRPDREIIDNTPWDYVRAALEGKKIRFREGKILHLKEPSVSGKSSEWGTPIIMAGLKDAYLNQIYKKADESVANERSVPARFVYPQPTSDNPLGTISLAKFSNFMGQSLRRWRHDKNAVMVSPFPVGVAEVGGDAQRLNTANLRQLTIREIIGSTGVPEGFLADGMTWSGGSVQLRMLENMIMGYKRALDRMLWFVVSEVEKITEWPHVDVHMKPFRMADDIQMLQILLQLAQLKHVSFEEILERIDLDWEEEHKKVLRETEKVMDINLKESLLEVKSMLQAVDYQVEVQGRESSVTELIQEKNKSEEATTSHLKRIQSFDEYKDSIEERDAEAGQEEAQEQQQAANVKQTLDAARAEKYKAEAARTESRIAPIVQNLTDRLMRMSEGERNNRLQALVESAPVIAEQVQEQLELRMSGSGQQAEEGEEQVEGGGDHTEEPAETQGGSSEDPSEVLNRLRTESKSPADMANSIIMLPGNIRQAVFAQLRQEDPQLAITVMRELVGSRKKGRGGGGSISPPQPEQRPPRSNQ